MQDGREHDEALDNNGDDQESFLMNGEEGGSSDLAESQAVATKPFKFSFHGKQFDWRSHAGQTIEELSFEWSETFQIDHEKLKIMMTPRPGLMKSPFPKTPLDDLLAIEKTKIQLIGSTSAELSELNAAVAAHKTLQLRGGRQRIGGTAKASKYRDSRKIQEEAQYTFHMIKPLPYLPNPERSTRFLERLRDDPGIKTAMRAHKFSVPLLTEMNPAEHTTRESRTLGLNRNKGEVIELRLRTDAYDGYRDYKVIRKTLCHELSHCVFSEHDRDFWDLTNQIEKEVEKADWKHGGHKLSNDEFYNPQDEGEEGHFDHGGWTGGEFVLGVSAGTTGANNNEEGLSRREILARAAMGRIGKQKDPPSSHSSGAGQEKN